MAPQGERLSFYRCTLSFYIVIFFSIFDANKLHWATIGANLSFIGYIGVPFLVAGVEVGKQSLAFRSRWSQLAFFLVPLIVILLVLVTVVVFATYIYTKVAKK